MANEIPAVSVIIPMYNVEKYIAETLNSVLGQTLKNFELIVVDDCSTDKSCEIVESFIPKFDGRLKLIHMKKNSGGPSLPRNKGLEFSRGKYVFFMDNDDVILVNALENFFKIAEQTQADILYCKKYLTSMGVGKNFVKSSMLVGNIKDVTVNLVTEDLNWRLQAWGKNFFEVYPWLKFVRRDFLIENEIKFLPVVQEDSYWTFELLCLAKKIILVPHLFYIYRRYQEQTSMEAFDFNLNAKGVHKKIDRIINGLKHVDEFMGGLEFFQKNPAYRYAVVNHIMLQNMSWMLNSYGRFSPMQIYEKIVEALKNEAGNFDVLISCLMINSMNMVRILSGKK